MPGFLLRNFLLLAVEFGAAALLRDPGTPWIPVLLAVFVAGSAVPHGTEAEFGARFLVALTAVGVARAGATAWEGHGVVVSIGLGLLLLVQTAALLRLSLRSRRRPARRRGRR
ncbi:hypothetical protein BX286_2110 [Streptomyces sp. 3211.6]|uniref:hypothetical protein n=1 Tax=Streptomyces TaxID=1883 RepID=UPI0009A5498C|nr:MULTISPECIES: hypothetical protein [Streptomyces]RKT04164.1 hypothetical protein BX286_2110 [Streptomyces sp. 3211.6]RPF40042.1 hypothetical protein EDD96_3793 [Streptomyces sp. Ag109_G2-6]